MSRKVLRPRSARARNRLRDHTLEVVRHGTLEGASAVLTRCTDRDCPNIAKDGTAWSGWFTDTEIDLQEQVE